MLAVDYKVDYNLATGAVGITVIFTGSIFQSKQ
jgi:hypothetical protein